MHSKASSQPKSRNTGSNMRLVNPTRVTPPKPLFPLPENEMNTLPSVPPFPHTMPSTYPPSNRPRGTEKWSIWVGGEPNVDLSQTYIIGEQLGRPGAYGYAILATHKTSKQQMAIKVVDKTVLAPEDLESLRSEVNVMRQIQHPFIAKFIQATEDEQFVKIVMEACFGGEMLDKLTETGTFDEVKTRQVFRQMNSAVKYLHARGVAHCDLKPDNILFQNNTDKSDIRVIDFGLAKFCVPGNCFHEITGTPYYIAPEVLQGSYTYHCDMWAIGVLLFIMCFGFAPFDADNLDSPLIHEQLERGFTAEVKPGRGPYFPLEMPISAPAMHLIQHLLIIDTTTRMTAAEASMHPFVLGNTLDSCLSFLSWLTPYLFTHPVAQALAGAVVDASLLHQYVLYLMSAFKELNKASGSQTDNTLLSVGSLSTLASRAPQHLRSFIAVLLRAATFKRSALCVEDFTAALCMHWLLCKAERLAGLFGALACAQADVDGTEATFVGPEAILSLSNYTPKQPGEIELFLLNGVQKHAEFTKQGKEGFFPSFFLQGDNPHQVDRRRVRVTEVQMMFAFGEPGQEYGTFVPHEQTQQPQQHSSSQQLDKCVSPSFDPEPISPPRNAHQSAPEYSPAPASPLNTSQLQAPEVEVDEILEYEEEEQIRLRNIRGERVGEEIPESDNDDNDYEDDYDDNFEYDDDFETGDKPEGHSRPTQSKKKTNKSKPTTTPHAKNKKTKVGESSGPDGKIDKYKEGDNLDFSLGEYNMSDEEKDRIAAARAAAKAKKIEEEKEEKERLERELHQRQVREEQEWKIKEKEKETKEREARDLERRLDAEHKAKVEKEKKEREEEAKRKDVGRKDSRRNTPDRRRHSNVNSDYDNDDMIGDGSMDDYNEDFDDNYSNHSSPHATSSNDKPAQPVNAARQAMIDKIQRELAALKEKEDAIETESETDGDDEPGQEQRGRRPRKHKTSSHAGSTNKDKSRPSSHIKSRRSSNHSGHSGYDEEFMRERAKEIMREAKEKRLRELERQRQDEEAKAELERIEREKREVEVKEKRERRLKEEREKKEKKEREEAREKQKRANEAEAAQKRREEQRQNLRMKLNRQSVDMGDMSPTASPVPQEPFHVLPVIVPPVVTKPAVQQQPQPQPQEQHKKREPSPKVRQQPPVAVTAATTSQPRQRPQQQQQQHLQPRAHAQTKTRPSPSPARPIVNRESSTNNTYRVPNPYPNPKASHRERERERTRDTRSTSRPAGQDDNLRVRGLPASGRVPIAFDLLAPTEPPHTHVSGQRRPSSHQITSSSVLSPRKRSQGISSNPYQKYNAVKNRRSAPATSIERSNPYLAHIQHKRHNGPSRPRPPFDVSVKATQFPKKSTLDPYLTSYNLEPNPNSARGRKY